ncbi:hypothetical protein, partial [Aeromonas aquatica]|uniref:hypothetical protein n=1 Tax=Aeromonas aquatica TaxID=558964 RepID=UPI001EE6A340
AAIAGRAGRYHAGSLDNLSRRENKALTVPMRPAPVSPSPGISSVPWPSWMASMLDSWIA